MKFEIDKHEKYVLLKPLDIEELNSEKVLGIVTHFKELSGYSINFLNKSDYNTTLTCE